MTTLDDKQLLTYNKKGLFPGPKESENDFVLRANRFLTSSYFVDDACSESLETAEKLYDIKPNWVRVEYTDLGLRFWEAAHVEVSPKHFHFQLRKSMLEHPKYLGLYCKKEILAHEFSHVGRMNFPDSRFEELFAFQTSNRIRRFLGPIFSNPRQSMGLVILTTMSLLGDFLLRGTPMVWAFFKLLPIFYLGFLGLKLCFTRRHYSKTVKKLKKIVKNPDNARYITYRLTEKEIIKFSRSRLKTIESYMEQQKSKELRWKLIHLAYLNSAA